MNRFDFANGVIAAPVLSRIFDRAFLFPIILIALVWVTAFKGGTNYDNAIEFTKWVVGTFILAEKGKDAATAMGALFGEKGATINAGTIATSDVPANAEEFPNAS